MNTTGCNDMEFRRSPWRNVIRCIAGVVLSGLWWAVGAAQAQPAPAFGTPAQEGAEEKDRTITDLLRRVEALEKKLAEIQGTRTQGPPATASQALVPGPSIAPTANASAGNEPAEPETLRALERALVREGGLALPSGAFEAEPRLAYEYGSSKGLQIVDIGGVPQVTQQYRRRDTLRAGLSLRMGVPWSTQLEAAIPYSVGWDRRDFLGAPSQSDRSTGFGNLQLGLTTQFVNESAGRPGLLGTIRWQDRGDDSFGGPTAVASSFRSLTGALTLIKRYDPMVFFGSLSRTMNYSRSIRGLTIDPGNTTGVKLGSILAISPGTSMRAGLELSRAAGATINGTPLPGSSATAGFFNTGFSFGLTPRQLLNIEAGIGLTTDSPDFRIEASLPIRF